ncbi:MAG: Unknown protein [uncultured Sulfurovum sp.]|uniref:Uncharacterized protein n=1 Tax=uncultured Sulfurovum sp. TaxID=269237 RepID=A0A6S6U386_9BACT|nr:MAG: Unknown protein [uncultured Sulfurovum sp.]
MKKVAVITTIIASVLLSSASAMADSRSNDRWVNTQSIHGVNPVSIELRISQGIRSGKLTDFEAKQLLKGLSGLKATLRSNSRLPKNSCIISDFKNG